MGSDYYNTADAGYIDDEGYVFVMSRTDDIINTAGHRLSTGGGDGGSLANHADGAECAVIGVYDALKGQVPVGFLGLNVGVSRPPSEIEEEAIHMVGRDIGPVSVFKTALTSERLPKTRSGKVLRGTILKMPASQIILTLE